ncbi:MAG: hypothetical protein H7831_14480, partial [Magnetococcus sp. WYHC-3]
MQYTLSGIQETQYNIIDFFPESSHNFLLCHLNTNAQSWLHIDCSWHPVLDAPSRHIQSQQPWKGAALPHHPSFLLLKINALRYM